MSTAGLHILVPGPIEQRTGGYIYDARIVQGLRDRGWNVCIHSLPGEFPLPENDAFVRVLASITAG